MTSNTEPNKVSDFFHGVSKFIYIIGGPNFWPEKLQLPNWFHKIHKPISIITHSTSILLVALEWGALYTQTDLSEKQKWDVLMFSFSHTILYCYLINAVYYADTIKGLFKNLALDSKCFSDKDIERNSVKRMKYFSWFCMSMICFTIIMYGVESVLQVIMHEGTRMTITTAWPDINDHSKLADVVRILSFIAWWIFGLPVSAVSYCLVITVTVSLSLQFKNLTGHFYSLNDIFKENEDQKEKEKRYEEGFKIGIQWHADILRCIKHAQKSLAVVFGGQIIVNVTLISILLLQFANSERTLGNVLAILSTAFTLLFSTGCFMWNAGDISVEAFALSRAMFESGWHNCTTEALVKIRSIITVAIWQSQRPVQLRCFGVVEMSYESYLNIVKSSYSIFSVLY